MNVLVLGSTGFVGKNLVTRLRKDGHCVSAAQRSTGVDLRDYGQTLALLRETSPQVVYNLASHGGSVHYVKSKAAEVYHDNVQMALNLYRAIAKVDNTIKVVQPLSNCSYPGKSSIQREEEWLDGDVHPSVFPFGNAKRSIYYISSCYAKQFGVKSVNLLLPNTYGPGDSEDPNHTHALNGMVIRMLKAKQENKKEFIVWGTGSPVREWAYIDDFVEMLVRGLDLDEMQYPLNVAQGKGYSIAESAKMIKELCGFQGELKFDTSYADGDPIKVLDSSNFASKISNFKFYPHEQGIQNTILYYKKLFNMEQR